MGFEKFESKMKEAGCSQAAIDAFRVNYEQLVGGATGMVSPCTPLVSLSTKPLASKKKLFRWSVSWNESVYPSTSIRGAQDLHILGVQDYLQDMSILLELLSAISTVEPRYLGILDLFKFHKAAPCASLYNVQFC